MANRIIKPDSGNTLVLQDEGGSAALTIDTSGDTTVSGDLNPASGPANFVGMIAPFGKASGTIDGWLYCDGSTLNSDTDTQFANLYSVIGTTWGGSSSSSFKIPDLEGAFLRGTGSHGTSTMANGSAFAGPSVGSFENDQIQNHGHTIKVHSTGTSGGISLGVASTPTNIAGQVFGLEATTSGSPRGGNETRPFNAGVRYYIKY